ncbi:Zona pellucida domain [Trinorchestia longiramus]|nr:Zona pellucida domain [Trinorchestia longiramus]
MFWYCPYCIASSLRIGPEVRRSLKTAGRRVDGSHDGKLLSGVTELIRASPQHPDCLEAGSHGLRLGTRYPWGSLDKCPRHHSQPTAPLSAHGTTLSPRHHSQPTAPLPAHDTTPSTRHHSQHTTPLPAHDTTPSALLLLFTRRSLRSVSSSGQEVLLLLHGVTTVATVAAVTAEATAVTNAGTGAQVACGSNAQLVTKKNPLDVSIKDVRIFCNSNDIVVSIEASAKFNGMIYPKGLSKNSSCMAEFKDQINPVLYKLPLKSCNTMSTELDDGIEYFNTVVVQPHRKLVTNQGRGYHIRCKYQTQEKTITNAFNVSDFNVSLRGDAFGADGKEDVNGTSFLGTTPLTATAPMPGCYMRIFSGEPSDRLVAENVRIGDPLTMVISLDNQEIYGMRVWLEDDVYGMRIWLGHDREIYGMRVWLEDVVYGMRIWLGHDKEIYGMRVWLEDDVYGMRIWLGHDKEIYEMRVTNCLVRDGLGWGEQMLINDQGCPVDYEILGPFEYSSSKTTAAVRFQAHKFPYTSSVYYQCNVQLCIKNADGCADVPPVCVEGQNLRRRRRDVSLNGDGDLSEVEAEVDEDLTIEVFSGLYVNEEEELPEPDLQGGLNSFDIQKEELEDPDKFCLSPKTFAIGIAIAGLILMIAVIAAILVLISRRRRRKDDSTTGSSIYSGPYTNTAYSHSS